MYNSRSIKPYLGKLVLLKFHDRELRNLEIVSRILDTGKFMVLIDVNDENEYLSILYKDIKGIEKSKKK